MTETVAAILDAHRAGRLSPEQTVARSFARIRAHADPAVFITLRDEAEVTAEARALAREGKTARALYGVPIAVKDNIDVKDSRRPQHARPLRTSPARMRQRSRGSSRPAR